MVLRWSIRILATAALAGVFMLYLQPDFLVLLAGQVWACF